MTKQIRSRCLILFFFSADKVRRPVFVVGPLADIISVRLTNDFPNVFQACKWSTVNSEKSAEEGVQKNIFVDYRPKGSKFEGLSADHIRAISKNVSSFV